MRLCAAVSRNVEGEDMTTDLKSMTVEELCEKALYTRLAAYEIARRLEEAQDRYSELFHAYHQACTDAANAQRNAARLAARAAKAKAEAMEEAVDKCKRLTIRGREVSHRDCVQMLEDGAAEYRAKAGRKT